MTILVTTRGISVAAGRANGDPEPVDQGEVSAEELTALLSRLVAVEIPAEGQAPLVEIETDGVLLHFSPGDGGLRCAETESEVTAFEAAMLAAGHATIAAIAKAHAGDDESDAARAKPKRRSPAKPAARATSKSRAAPATKPKATTATKPKAATATKPKAAAAKRKSPPRPAAPAAVTARSASAPPPQMRARMGPIRRFIVFVMALGFLLIGAAAGVGLALDSQKSGNKDDLYAGLFVGGLLCLIGVMLFWIGVRGGGSAVVDSDAHDGMLWAQVMNQHDHDSSFDDFGGDF